MEFLKIIKSWYDFATADEATKNLMVTRLAVCESCPFKQQMSETGQFIIRTINEEGSVYSCEKCGCPLSAKTANPKNSCPIGKWSAINKESFY